MLAIGKAVILLILELIIEYLFGTFIVKLLLRKKLHPFAHLLAGFLSWQVLFQVTALVFIFTTGILHHLTIAWGILTVLVVAVSIISTRETIKEQAAGCLRGLREHKLFCGLALAVVLVFCFYVSINGENNEDARYYIALMTTSVDTDSMFQYNVYNGYQTDSLYLRRVLVTFEMHGAVLSQMTGIHPLIIARVFRACQNVVLSSAAAYLCSQLLFWKNERNAVDKSLLSVAVFWLMQLVSADSIYASAQFVLYRAYEAKAFTAGMIVLTGLYLCVKMLADRDYRMLFLLGVFLWGSMAISTSAFIVAFAECFVLIAGVVLWRMIAKKRREKLHAG